MAKHNAAFICQNIHKSFKLKNEIIKQEKKIPLSIHNSDVLSWSCGLWQRDDVDKTGLNIELIYYIFNLIIYTLQNNSGK